MHKLVTSSLNDFRKKFSVDRKESEAFELFINYMQYNKYCADYIDIEDLYVPDPEPGIDGAMIFCNDEYVSSVDDMNKIFSTSKKDVDVHIVFTQAKTGESWDKKQINTFESALLDFLSDEKEYEYSDYLLNVSDMIQNIFDNIGRISAGRPSVECIFANSAPDTLPREIESAQKSIERKLKNLDVFKNIEVKIIGRSGVSGSWVAANGMSEATFSVIGMAAFPAIPSVDMGYVVTMDASAFVESVLCDDDGKLKHNIFDQNVRDYIGEDNNVNNSMINTIIDTDKRDLFGVLNNGITIIASEVKVAGLSFNVKDYSIVNGCQTSNVLYRNKDVLGKASVVVKIIGTRAESVVDDVVRSTNSQTKVDDSQFLAMMDSVKSIESYFNAIEDNEFKLYFERRKNQYNKLSDIKTIRIFDIKEIARIVGSMYFDKPEIASRYPRRLTSDLSSVVFSDKNSPEIYYAAALAAYRLKLIFSNKGLDADVRPLRWHLLMALRYYIVGTGDLSSSAKKSAAKNNQVIEFFSRKNEDILKDIQELIKNIFSDKETITRDKLRSPSYTASLKKAVLKYKQSKEA